MERNNRQRIKSIWQFGKKYIPFFLLAEVCILVSYAISVLLPLNLTELTDKVLYGEQYDLLPTVICNYVLLFLVATVFNFIYAFVWQYLNNHYVLDVKNKLFEKIIFAKASFLSGMNSGDMMTRIDGDAEQFIHVVQRNLFHFINSAIMCAGIVVLVARLNFTISIKEEGYYELFLLELMTGMRRGEILALKWSDLDFKTGELKIERQVRGGVISVPKTKSSVRTVILPTELLRVLKDYKEKVNSEWIFPSPKDSSKTRDPSAVRKRLQIILERAGCKRVRFHDLRHTFATMALENGMDVKTLSATIGHMSAKTTLNVYSHITDTMREQAAVKIDRSIGGTDAQMPRTESKSEVSEKPPFEPYKPKIRKAGTGCISKLNEHLYEGRYSPSVGGRRISRNVYAKTREECEEKLAELIKKMKSELKI